MFLDDIEDGTDEQPLTGGYQILRQLEVGVDLLRGAPLGLPAQLDRLWNRRSRQLCSAADLCTTVQEVLDDLRRPHPVGPTLNARQPCAPSRKASTIDCSNCTGSFFSILFLRASPEAEPARIGATLGRLWSMYQGLKTGQVEDLPGHPVAPGDLQVLVAYGTEVFQRPEAGRELPDELRTYGFPHHDMVADAPVLANSGLAYASDVGDNVAEADIAVQLTGTTQIAVYRGVVETWKCLHDLALESAPGLELAGFYSGHQRDDRRSWIDFHDGINNLPKRERERAIAIKPSPDAGWTAGGTYLAYLRVVVDLAAWRRLSRTEQEHLVGRDKLTGAPLLVGWRAGVRVPGGGHDRCPAEAATRSSAPSGSPTPSGTATSSAPTPTGASIRSSPPRRGSSGRASSSSRPWTGRRISGRG